MLRATSLSTFLVSDLPKTVRVCFGLFWLGHALRVISAFFDIYLQKARSSMFLTIGLKNRALLWELNFQKWSENVVFCAFWLENALRITAACIFFMSRLATWLRTRCFRKPTFRPQFTGKTQCFATFLNILRACIFCLLTLFLSLFYSSLSSTFLCFSSLHSVGSLASKLPLIQ